MLKKIKELQSLVDERTNALKRTERKIEDMNIVIATLENQESSYQKEKRELKSKYYKQKDLITKVANLVKANKYNNEKAILGKIKELVTDYQSNN